MVNNINNGGATPANVRLDATKQATEQATKQAQTTSVNNTRAASDSVTITSQANQLKSLSQKAEHASGVDEKKVNELKRAIANGEYKVDAEKLAENISNLEFGLFGR
jgi:negative regulator of flagellin synthesis FlgM